jgi:hypothetical protein
MINSDQTAAGLPVIMACTEGGLDVLGQIDTDTEIKMHKYRRKTL